MTAKAPTSKAKTAYALLSEISALILAEPKRIAMGIWKEQGIPGFTKSTDSSFVPDLIVELPDCGMVGCIGGWTEILKPDEDNFNYARAILGLTRSQEHELCYPRRLCSARHQQTTSHARKVAAHIRIFQKKYRAQLLAKKV